MKEKSRENIGFMRNVDI